MTVILALGALFVVGYGLAMAIEVALEYMDEDEN